MQTQTEAPASTPAATSARLPFRRRSQLAQPAPPGRRSRTRGWELLLVLGRFSESLGDFTKLFLETPGRSDWFAFGYGILYLSPGPHAGLGVPKTCCGAFSHFQLRSGDQYTQPQINPPSVPGHAMTLVRFVDEGVSRSPHHLIANDSSTQSGSFHHRTVRFSHDRVTSHRSTSARHRAIRPFGHITSSQQRTMTEDNTSTSPSSVPITAHTT